MYFDSLGEALAMAGHGPYVWSAYALTAAVLVALVWAPVARARALRRGIRAELRRMEGSSTANSAANEEIDVNAPQT